MLFFFKNISPFYINSSPILAVQRLILRDAAAYAMFAEHSGVAIEIYGADY